jgi:hypothetical protein
MIREELDALKRSSTAELHQARQVLWELMQGQPVLVWQLLAVQRARIEVEQAARRTAPPAPASRAWKPPGQPLPGQHTDAAVAAAHGVTAATVRHYRQRMGIQGVRGRGRPQWAPDPSISPQPGEASARAVAAAHGVSPTTVAAYLRRCNQL